MTELKEFASRLNMRDIEDYGYNILTKDEITEARRKGIVALYGYSDDNMEFEGAIRDEVGCFNGGTAYVNDDGLCGKDDPAAMEIKALWYKETIEIDGLPEVFPWSYKTKIPHEEFYIYEGGDPFCVGIVFYLDKKRNTVLPPTDHEILFAKVKETAIIPTKDPENAGYDIYPCFEEDVMIIEPHTTKMVPTGIACAISPKWFFKVEERGSTGSRGIKKSAGIIDSGYRGEIFVAVTNTNEKTVVISKHDVDKTSQYAKGIIPNYVREKGVIYYPYAKAIAQLVLLEVPVMKTVEIPYEDLLKIPSKRGTGKLGSSKK